MSRAGILQAHLGLQLLEEVKQEAASLGLSASSYVRLLVRRRPSIAVSEKGTSKKAAKARAKRTVLGARRKP